MKAARVGEHDVPEYGDFRDPSPANGQQVLRVVAAGINHLDVAIASGKTYARAPQRPYVPGSDGVGVDDDGRRFYFDEPVAPFGALAERALVRRDMLMPVHDGVDSVTAAALGNAGIAAMLALTTNGRVREGNRVLVLGATGTVGSLLVQIARVLGARHVVGVGRDPGRLAQLQELGAACLDLTEPLTAERIRSAAGGPVDVIVDMLWGAPAIAAIEAAAVGARLVQLGQKADPVAAVPASAIRSRLLRLVGSAGFLEPHAVRAEAYERVLELAAGGRLRTAIEAVPLSQIGAAWERQRAGAGIKLVAVPAS